MAQGLHLRKRRPGIAIDAVLNRAVRAGLTEKEKSVQNLKEARELANKSWRKRCLDRKTNVTDTEEEVCLKGE